MIHPSPESAHAQRHSGQSEIAGTQTLMRGLLIVQAVADGCGDLKTICQRTGIARSTVHRLASLLIQQRYLRYADSGAYALGSALIALGYQAKEQMSIVELARPHLESLARQTGDTVHLAQRDGDELLYLDKIAGTRGLEMRSRIGKRMPLPFTGLGKALILQQSPAEWQRLFNASKPAGAGFVARQKWTSYKAAMLRYASAGYAFDLEENEPAICCIAAPIFALDGGILASISLTSSIAYLPQQRMQRLLPAVLASATAISSELGWQPPSKR